jgi:hypothetical protein
MLQDIVHTTNATSSANAELDPRSNPNSGAGSPWDGLLDPSPLTAKNIVSTSGAILAAYSSASDPSHTQAHLPKLVPEVEEGNVEYKLKLRE